MVILFFQTLCDGYGVTVLKSNIHKSTCRITTNVGHVRKSVERKGDFFNVCQFHNLFYFIPSFPITLRAFLAGAMAKFSRPRFPLLSREEVYKEKKAVYENPYNVLGMPINLKISAAMKIKWKQ